MDRLANAVHRVRSRRGEPTRPPDPSTRSSRDRVASLDLVRALAAAMVVLCHVSLFRGDGSLVGFKNGVLLFFALSGYLLYRPFLAGSFDLRRYATARIVRIVPAYLVAVVGVALLTRDATPFEHPLTYFLFAQQFDRANWMGFLLVSWTLSLEAAFYVVLPFIARLINGDPYRLFALAGLSLFGALFGIYDPSGRADPFASSLFPFMFWAFALGMLIAILEVRSQLSGGVVSLIGGLFMLGLSVSLNMWASVDVVGGLGAMLVVGWAVANRPSLGWFRPAAAAAAAISYSVYLWHVDLLKWAPNAVVGVAATMVIAVVVYVLVERPALGLARRLVTAPTRHRSAATPATNPLFGGRPALALQPETAPTPRWNGIRS